MEQVATNLQIGLLDGSIQEDLTPTQIKLLHIIRKKDLTRKEIRKKTGFKRTTIFDNLAKLQKIKVVGKYSVNRGNRGRPRVYWGLKVGNVFLNRKVSRAYLIRELS